MKRYSTYINEKLVISKEKDPVQKLCQIKLEDLKENDFIDAIKFADNKEPSTSEVSEISKFVTNHTANTYGSLIENPTFIIYLLSRYINEPDNDELYDSGEINGILYHTHFDDKFGKQKSISDTILDYFYPNDIYEIINNYLDGKKKRKIDSHGYWNYKLIYNLIDLLLKNNHVGKGELDDITVKCADDKINPTWLYSKYITEKCIKKLNYDNIEYEKLGAIWYNPNFTKESFIRICSIMEAKEYNYKHTYKNWITVPSYSNIRTNWSPRVIMTDEYKTNISLLQKFFPEFDDEKIMKSIMDNYARTKNRAIAILEGENESFKKYKELNK